jgi:hypothetical protein
VIRVLPPWRSASACAEDKLPIQLHSDSRNPWRDDAQWPQERAGRPARGLLRVRIEQVEDIDESSDTVGEPIKASLADSLPMLSYDEHVMFFHSTRPGGCGTSTGDIWMTWRRDARSQEWEPPTNLGCVLNTAATEIAPAFFENPETEEITLFYGSNRPGSLGFDVYASAVGEDRYFGPGVLVPEFSSPGRDTRIFIRKDGLEAFVTSDRLGGQGRIDIWTSTRETLSDPWSTPLVDLPSPLNSACDDGSPWLSRDGTTLYFFSTRAGLERGTETSGTRRE